MFVGQGPGYTPPSRIWCTLLILWQPRPSSPMPPPTLADVFPFRRLLEAAEAIRDICWGGSHGTGAAPVLGRMWVLPNEWVDVQFAVSIGPPSIENRRNVSEGRQGGGTRVLLADGSHTTYTASGSSLNNTACSGLIDHAQVIMVEQGLLH